MIICDYHCKSVNYFYTALLVWLWQMNGVFSDFFHCYMSKVKELVKKTEMSRVGTAKVGQKDYNICFIDFSTKVEVSLKHYYFTLQLYTKNYQK